jgi:hypothetical protein
MKYKRQIDKIRAGTYSRSELIRLRDNVERIVRQGDDAAREVLEEIDRATPADRYLVFIGFCPNADFSNRLDTEWREQGVCTFVFHESEQQSERFNSIWPGDLIILKKRHHFGESIQLFGHGRVIGIKHDTAGHRYLEMNWAAQQRIIEVPLMGCNSTVDVRSIEQVETQMPPEFYGWLGEAGAVA